MDENKACRIEDEALQNVAGGKDDKKYYVGDTVKFKRILIANLPVIGDVSLTLTGKITAINDGVYAIEAGGNIYYVKENLIKGLATITVDGGISGGWN